MAMHGPFLTGQVDHVLDDKGRLTLPAGFREPFIGESYFVPSSHGGPYVRLYDLESWRTYDAKHIEPLDPFLNRQDDDQIGDLYERMYRVVPDKQGRVVVPQEIVESLGLEGKVRITGHRDHLRLWHPPAHARYRAARAAERAAAAGDGPSEVEDAS
jgi:MraZ protein